MMTLRRPALAVIAIAAALAASAMSAEAARRNAYRDNADVVVAVSRFGNGHVTGAVRPTSVGPQVQLPSGSWVYCRRSCSETLRVETVDLNEDLRDSNTSRGGKLAGECGIFGCLELKYPHD